MSRSTIAANMKDRWFAASAEINIRFLYLATDARVGIGADDITQARAVLSERRTS